MSPKKVLIIGVYGLIGGEIYMALTAGSEESGATPPRYDVYGLARRRHPSDRSSEDRNLNIPDDHFVLSDLGDLDVLVDAMQEIDVVVHMAADPRMDAPWESVLASNIIGTRNIYEAARICGVDRVIYASSNTVSWGYFDDEPYSLLYEGRYDEVAPEEITPVTHTWPTRPTSEYAASKVWGEGLGRVYATQRDLSVICLRIGWVNDEDRPLSGDVDRRHGWARAGWCSKRDIVQLVEKCIQAPPTLRYDIFYGLSEGAYNWNDIQHAKDVLGYAPQDDAEDLWEPPES
jgi:nucleoside-diphosphate-sugar epimerase